MRRLRQIAASSCVLFGLFSVSCHPQSPPGLSPSTVIGKHRTISDLISDLRSSSVPKSTSAFVMLFAVGDSAIPALLDAGNDSTPMSWVMPAVLSGQSYVPLVSNAQGSASSYRPTVGIACLYLIEAIRQHRLVHADCIIADPGEPTWEAVKRASEHQERALQQYRVWYTNQSSSATEKEPGVRWATSASDYKIEDVRVLSEIMTMIVRRKS